MYDDDGSVRPAQPSLYETIPSGPPRRHSPQRRPFPCNFPPRRPGKISCYTCPCRSVDPNTHSAITGSSISLYGYCTPECNGSVSPYAKTATAQRQSMNWLRVFRSPDAAYLGYGGGHEWLTRAPSEKCVARWGSAYDTIDTAMGFEVRLIQHTPDTRTTHGPKTPLMEGGDQVVKTPVGGRAVVRGGFAGGHRQHIQTR